MDSLKLKPLTWILTGARMILAAAGCARMSSMMGSTTLAGSQEVRP